MKALKLLEPKQQKTFRDKYLAVMFAVAALLISSVATAQLDSAKYSPISGYGFKYKRMAFDSVLMVPRSTSPHIPWRAGAIRYNAPDSTLQLWTGYQWNSILTGIGNGVDTAYMINDTVLTIETPDQDYLLIIPGRPRVDSIYRKSGQDSIFYLKNGAEYAIKDSSGSSGDFITELTGDVTATGPGSATATIAPNAVTNTKLAQAPAFSVKGNAFNSVDDVGDILALNDHSVLRRNGTSINFGAINLASSNAVTGILPLGNLDTTSTNHVVTQSDLNDAIGSTVGINQLTGDVTAGPGTGSQAATIANNAVTTAKINNAAVTIAKISATGTADNTTVLYGDGAWRAPAGGGIVYTFSATAPTGSDTSKLWIKTPAVAGVYNVYTYISNLQYPWQRLGWLSIDGVFSTKRPVTIAMCGQSNAAGVGPGGDTSWMPGIIAFGQVGGGGVSTDYQTVWRQARINQSPFYSSNNNIAFAVAKRLKRNNNADIVRIITTYEGGTNLSAWIKYLSNPTFLLDTFRSRLNRSGIDTIDAFLWHQGESGGVTGFTLGGYYVDQKVLYDTLCSPLTKGFFRNYTKYIAGGLGDATDSTFQYNAGSPEGAQRRLNTDGNLNTAWVPSWGLSNIGDGIHFAGTAIDTLGFRYYTEVLRLPHAPTDEQPKFMYDTLYDKYKVYENLLTDYNGGSPAFKLLGTGISWKTNSYGRLLTLAPSPGSVHVGELVGYTNSVHKMFTINGKSTISDGAYNTIIAGNWNVTGDPAHNAIIANYPLNFNTTSGGDESVMIGYDAGYSTVNMPFNAVIIGSEAGKNTSANFVNYVGRQSGENTTGIFNAFYGPRSGRNSQGSYNTVVGADAGALNSTARVNSTAIGYQATYNEDSVFVAGNGLKKFIIGGTTVLPFRIGTPSNGDTWVWNNTNSQFELTNASGGITSINSNTGSAIVVQGGTALSVDNSVPDFITLNVTPNSTAMPHTLDAVYTTAGNTGSSETDLFSYTLPAGYLVIDGRTLNFEIDGEFNDNTITAQLKLYFGGNVTLNTGAVSVSTAFSKWKIKGYIMRTSSSTAHVTYEMQCPGLATPVFLGYSNLTSLDFTTTNVFKISAQAAGGGASNSDITAHSWQLLYKPQPQ